MSSEAWETVLLGELCRFTKGSSPTLKTLPGRYPLIVTGPEPLSSSEYQFEGEAVCVPMVSSTGHGHASLKRVHFASGRFAVANIVTACEVKNPALCSTRFLHIYLQHHKDELIVPRMQGTANVSLSQRELARVPVRLPRLGEQQRIVDLLGSLDQATEAAEETKYRLVRTRQALRREVFAQAEAAGSIPLAELATTRLGKMLSATTAKKDPEAPYLRNADVQWGRINTQDLKVMPFSLADRTEFSLAKGDVLVCEGGEIGRCSVLDADLPEIYFQKALHRVRCGEFLDPYFFQLCMEHMAEDGTLALFSGSSTIPHLTGQKLRKIPIPRLSLDRQREATSMNRALIDAISGYEAVADGLRRLRKELLSALLSGEHRIPETYDDLLGANLMNATVE